MGTASAQSRLQDNSCKHCMPNDHRLPAVPSCVLPACRMTVDRRALFDFAMLVHRQLEQQEQQRDRQQRRRDADAFDEEAESGSGGSGDDAETEGSAGSDDFVHVAPADAVGGSVGQPHAWQAAPAPPGAPMAQAAMAPKVRPAALSGDSAECLQRYAGDSCLQHQASGAPTPVCLGKLRQFRHTALARTPFILAQPPVGVLSLP